MGVGNGMCKVYTWRCGRGVLGWLDILGNILVYDLFSEPTGSPDLGYRQKVILWPAARVDQFYIICDMVFGQYGSSFGAKYLHVRQ